MFLRTNLTHNTRFGLAAFCCCFGLYSVPGAAMIVDQDVFVPLCTAQGIEWIAFTPDGDETPQPTHDTGCHAICSEGRKRSQMPAKDAI